MLQTRSQCRCNTVAELRGGVIENLDFPHFTPVFIAHLPIALSPIDNTHILL